VYKCTRDKKRNRALSIVYRVIIHYTSISFSVRVQFADNDVVNFIHTALDIIVTYLLTYSALCHTIVAETRTSRWTSGVTGEAKMRERID